jgi:DNA-binding beta-propeller fold protein YncE
MNDINEFESCGAQDQFGELNTITNRGSRMKKILLSMTLVSFVLLGTVAVAAPPASGYHLLKKVPLGAAPGGGEYFDYVTVDSAARRVYLSHGAEVKVIDTDNFSVVGTISGLKRCHGIVVLPELGKGFITDGDAAQVVVFDLKSLKITGKIKSAPDTDSMIYDPASKLIFTFNGDSKNSTVIDPVNETVVKVIDLGGAVEQSVADGKGMIYDNNEEKNDIAVIDTQNLTVKTRWPAAPAGSPVAIEMDREHRRLFSSGREPQFLDLIDADSGKVLQSLPISSGVDANVFDPETGLLFVSTRVGKLHIFHEDSPDKLSEVETLTTEYGAKTMNIDPKTHNLFLVTSDFGAPGPPTKKHPKPERAAVPGTFRVLIYGR